MKVVLDASVAVKWYIPERNHEEARALRDDYLDGTHDLLAPALLPFEVVNALRYSGYYDGERLVEASATFPEYGIDLVPYRDLGSVADVATSLDIAIYDAAYVALALTTDGSVYTADSGLVDATVGSDYEGRAIHIRTYEDGGAERLDA